MKSTTVILAFIFAAFTQAFATPIAEIGEPAAIQLRASMRSQSCLLSWQNPIGNRAKRFVIEKSTDGVSFTYLTTIAPSEADVQEVTDHFLFDGLNIYRLKMIDQAGQVFYSAQVIANQPNKFFILAKPVQHDLQIWQANKNNIQEIVVTDISGKKMELNHFRQNENYSSLNVRNLSKGFYNISIMDQNGQIAHLHFVKN
jgi:hypothetical protein